jgi:hypothetical protein
VQIVDHPGGIQKGLLHPPPSVVIHFIKLWQASTIYTHTTTMNILQLSLLLAILLKCVTASESGVAQDVIDALEEDGFGSIRDDWVKWRDRNDLFDEVVMKSVDFIAGFINQVEDGKRLTFAALFVKRSDVVDKVLKRIKYYDYDLICLTDHRPELAESHDGFFKAIDKIKKPEYQEEAVTWSVINLFTAKKHDSVIHLIDALEKRPFDGRRLKNVAIQQAFMSGAWNSISSIVKKFHEHHAITPEEYAKGLISSWENDKSKAFRFLLTHADQGDLKVKKDDIYKNDPEFRETIDDAFSKAGPAGTRLRRPKERVRLAKETFSEIRGLESLGKGKEVGGIILGYLCGSEET